MSRLGGHDGVDCYLRVAVGAVLEAYGHTEAACHLPVGLALGGARAYGNPTNEVGQVLRDDRIEELGGRREAHLRDVEKELSALLESARDVEGVVQVRIVEKALPADGRAGLLEIDPHDDEQPVGVLTAQVVQPSRVFESGALVVDGARSRNHEEPRVLPFENRLYRAASIDDRSLGVGGGRQFLDEVHRRYQLFRLQHVHVPSLRIQHSSAPSRMKRPQPPPVEVSVFSLGMLAALRPAHLSFSGSRWAGKVEIVVRVTVRNSHHAIYCKGAGEAVSRLHSVNSVRHTATGWVLGARCWVLGSGCWVLGAGC